MAKPRLDQFNHRVPAFVIEKAERLLREVRPLWHPRAHREDLVAALIDAATAEGAARALTAYNPKLGEALQELEGEDQGPSETVEPPKG
jgi:hypothetical protein